MICLCREARYKDGKYAQKNIPESIRGVPHLSEEEDASSEDDSSDEDPATIQRTPAQNVKVG
jgi:hypothetical protein